MRASLTREEDVKKEVEEEKKVIEDLGENKEKL